MFAKFNCKSIIFNFQSSIFNFKAFSLIELSIVLIIIGLLIAGVTGGASLIQSAKVRSMINELKEYERAVYTFQAARGRYPGDVKNYGTFGGYSNYDIAHGIKPSYGYKASDFPNDFLVEFQKTAGTGVLPNDISAVFAELYNEGIIDFKPLGNSETADKNNTKKGTPTSKVDTVAHIRYFYTGRKKETPCIKGVENCYYSNGLAYFGKIKENLNYLDWYNRIKPKFLKAVDEKMDDGWYSTGLFRTACYGNYDYGYNSYDNAIRNGKNCRVFVYAM